MDGLDYRSRAPRTGELVVEKTYIELRGHGSELRLVASSNSVDRYGDVIEQD